MTRKDLRKGWTTGTCATAAAAAAWEALLTGQFPDPVTVTLPGGQTPAFPLVRKELGRSKATAGVTKDAGDDPDITHGAQIVATVARGEPGSGIAFRAGEGVGTVTRPGLPIPSGEPAINPVPREMIGAAIAAISERLGILPDAVVTIAIPGGERLAEKTLNGRLGIVGGLSILGTTGIVTPYSCSAWIEAIRRGVDVARASGLTHVAASTGRTSEAAVRALHSLPEAALIEMGDFAGGLLKYLRDHPVERLTLAGGFAKLSKLARGAMNLHSGASRVDVETLAGWLDDLGADAPTLAAAQQARMASEVLALARDRDLALGDRVAAEARRVALNTLGSAVQVDVAVFDRGGTLVGRADA